jgi:hypothetical protein
MVEAPFSLNICDITLNLIVLPDPVEPVITRKLDPTFDRASSTKGSSNESLSCLENILIGSDSSKRGFLVKGFLDKPSMLEYLST